MVDSFKPPSTGLLMPVHACSHFNRSAVAGEAAGISLGLLLAGTGGGARAGEMLAYAHDTQHEKIIRGEPQLRDGLRDGGGSRFCV